MYSRTRRKKHKIVSQNYMDMIPVRCKDRTWTKDEKGMVVIDMENRGFYHFIAQKFFKKPRISHIALDQYGTVVWENINGEHTVYDIVEIMKKTFADEQDRMIDRVVTFLATLQSCQFVVMK